MNATRNFIAGLLIAGIAFLSADSGQATDVPLDVPITKVELDQEGNVKAIEFGDETRLEAGKDYQIGVDVGDREVLGVRRLPLQISKDTESGAIDLAVPFDYGSSYGGLAAYCPFPCTVKPTGCSCPPRLEDYRFLALIELENSEFAVMMWPPD
jgi:hypothetical protein